MAYARIRPKRGSISNWQDANPILAEGEIGFEVPNTGVGTGVTRIKVGDGVKAWNDLPYAVAPELYVTELDTSDFATNSQLNAVSTIATEAYTAATNTITNVQEVSTTATEAKSIAETARTAAVNAQSYAESVNGNLASYVPLSGATMTGNLIAYSTNRQSSSVRNIGVQNADATYASTNSIIFKRG